MRSKTEGSLPLLGLASKALRSRNGKIRADLFLFSLSELLYMNLIQEPQTSSLFRTQTAGSLQSWDRRVRLRLFWGMELRLPLELFIGFQAPCQTVCGICRFFQTMHGGVSDPSFFVFIHRVAFEEVSGHRVLMKSGPGYRGRSAFGTTHVGCLEFPHETGLILKCAAKFMKLFQTKQRHPLSSPSPPAFNLFLASGFFPLNQFFA